MSEYDKTNTFVLFVNDKKGNDKAPDRSGTLNVDGVDFYIDGWLKQGAKGPFLSGKIKPKQQQPNARGRGNADASDDEPF